MKKQFTFHLFAVLMLMLTITACNNKSDKETVFDPVGKWNYKVTTDVSYGVLTISRNDETYKASMTTEVFGTLELMNLKIEGEHLTADLDVGGTAAKITCDFDGNEMTGAVTAGSDKFPFEGKRQ